jgi:hypothetical protein
MTTSRILATTVWALLAASAIATAEVPQVLTIEPKNAKPGTVVSVTGVSLDQTKVDDAFLTDHRFDLKVKVLEQTPTSMKFRVPPFIKAGRQQLLLQTTGDVPKLLEQPVFLLIEIEDVVAAEPEKEKEKDKSASNTRGAANTTGKQ